MNTIQDTAKQQAEVMLAFAEGKSIEVSIRREPNRWTPVLEPLWDWCLCNYRVRKEPRTFYVILRGDGTPYKVFNDRQRATYRAASLNNYSVHGPYSIVETIEVWKED